MNPSLQRCSVITPVLVMAGLLALNLLTAWVVIVASPEVYHAGNNSLEDTWVEHIQVLFLALATVGFAVQAFWQQGRYRVLCLFLMMLCFIFIFRELDVEDFDVPQWVIFLFADNRGRAFFVVPTLILLGMVLQDWRHYLQNLRVYLKTPLFIALVLAAVLLLVFSQMFDRHWVSVAHNVLFEELSELSAYYLLLAMSVTARRPLAALQARFAA